MSNKTNNPWAGLSSYQDPETSDVQLKFCGRDNETFDVAQLIDDNIFVTLYGKSGTGKTSLLNAGVFPRLRQEQYLPVSIRLGMDALGMSFQQCILIKLQQALEGKGSQATVDVVPMPADEQATEYLWSHFARTRFVANDGRTLFPVLVFDQFEEVFRNRRTDAEALLRQIHFMMDESHALSDRTVDGQPYQYDFNFRFVASIREDDLYRLEDSIDNCYLPDMKRCRYRLRSLTEQGARDAILIPGEGLFRAGDENAIVDEVKRVATNTDNQGFSTYMLSLLCSQIYDESRKAHIQPITKEFVEGFVAGNPFDKFYLTAIAGLPSAEVGYLEAHFVDSSGRRNSVSEVDFRKNMPSAEKLLSGDAKILQRITYGTNQENGRVELIHDTFCEVVERQKLLRKMKLRQWLEHLVLMPSYAVVLLLCIIAYMFDFRHEDVLGSFSLLEDGIALLFIIPEIALSVIRSRSSLTSAIAGVLVSGYPFIEFYRHGGALAPSISFMLIICFVVTCFVVCLIALVHSIYKKKRMKIAACRYVDMLYAPSNRWWFFLSSFTLVMLGRAYVPINHSGAEITGLILLPLLLFACIKKDNISFTLSIIIFFFYIDYAYSANLIHFISLFCVFFIIAEKVYPFRNKRYLILWRIPSLFAFVFIGVLLESFSTDMLPYMSWAMPKDKSTLFEREEGEISAMLYYDDMEGKRWSDFKFMANGQEINISESIPYDTCDYSKDMNYETQCFHLDSHQRDFSNGLFKIEKDSLYRCYSWSMLGKATYYRHQRSNNPYAPSYLLFSQCVRYTIQQFTSLKLEGRWLLDSRISEFPTPLTKSEVTDSVAKSLCLVLSKCMLLEAMRDSDMYYFMDATKAFAIAALPFKDTDYLEHEQNWDVRFQKLAYTFYCYHQQGQHEALRRDDEQTVAIDSVYHETYGWLQDLVSHSSNQLFKNNLYSKLNVLLQVGYATGLLDSLALRQEYERLQLPTDNALRLLGN